MKQTRYITWLSYALLFCLVAFLGIGHAGAVNAMIEKQNQQEVINGYTFNYDIEYIGSTKCATNVYILDSVIEDDVLFPTTLGGCPIYSLGASQSYGKDSLFPNAESMDAFITIDCSSCSSMQVVNSLICREKSAFFLKLPQSIKKINSNAFLGATMCGIEILNPNTKFMDTSDKTASGCKVFCAKQSTASELYGSKCVQSGKVFGKTFSYTGKNTCKLSIASEEGMQMTTGYGFSYTYAICDAGATSDEIASTKCELPIKDYHSCIGLYTKDNVCIFRGQPYGDYSYTNLMSINVTPDSEVILYPKWEANSYYVSVHYDASLNEVDVWHEAYQYGSSYTTHGCLYPHIGQTFIGWSTEKDDTVEYEIGDVIGPEVLKDGFDLYPVYETNQYTVHFNPNCEQFFGDMDDASYTYSLENITLPENQFKRDGYLFKGWSTIPVSTYDSSDVMYVDSYVGPAIGGLTPNIQDAEITLYAVWEPISYQVQFCDSDDFSITTTINVHYDELFTMNGDIKFDKEGFEFIDWYDPETSNHYEAWEECMNLTTEPNKIVKLYTNRREYEYKIVFDANDGMGQMDDINLRVSQMVQLPKNKFIKDGCKFIGWSLSPCEPFGNSADDIEEMNMLYKKYSDGETVSDLTTKDKDVITLFPIWKTLEYSISYHYEEDAKFNTLGTSINTSYLYGQEDALPTVSRKGYDFLGWKMEDGEIINSVKGQTKDLNLTAQWKIWDCNIEIASVEAIQSLTLNETQIVENGKQLIHSIPYGTHINSIKCILYNDIYEDKGFNMIYDVVEAHSYHEDVNILSSETQIYCNEFVIDDNLLISPIIKNKEYTISYDTSGGYFLGENTTEQTYQAGIGINELPTPMKDGSYFNGWYNPRTEKIVTQISAKESGDISLIAKWDTLNIPVNFDLDGGIGTEITDITSYQYDSGKIELPIPTKDGYSFTGWYDKFTHRFYETIDTKDWTEHDFVAKWDDNCVTSIEKILVNPEEAIDMEYTHDILINDGFYYNQLLDEAKRVYTELYYYYKDENHFCDNTSLRFNIHETAEKQIENAVVALILEHPEIYWIRTFDLSDIDENGTICITPRFAYDKNDMESDRNEFDNNIVKYTTKPENVKEVIGYLRYILHYCSEMKLKDNNIENTKKTTNQTKSIGYAVAHGSLTSESFAKLTQYLLSTWGIESVICNGENSAWNFVKLEDGWYYVNMAECKQNENIVVKELWQGVPATDNDFYNNSMNVFTAPILKNDEPIPTTVPENPTPSTKPSENPISTSKPSPTSTSKPNSTNPVTTSKPNSSNENDVDNQKSEGLALNKTKEIKVSNVKFKVKRLKAGVLITNVKVNKKKVKLPKNIVVNGQTYKVIGLGKNAFAKCKKVKIIQFTSKYTRFDSKCFKGIYKKAKFYIPKAQYTYMKKKLKKRVGFLKTMKIKKI